MASQTNSVPPNNQPELKKKKVKKSVVDVVSAPVVVDNVQVVKEPKKKRSRQISVVKATDNDVDVSPSDVNTGEQQVVTEKKAKREKKVVVPQPLYIPPKRVKNYISDSVLNAVVNPVLAELQHHREDLVNKCNTLYSEFHLISQQTRDYLRELYNENIRDLREQYERSVWRSIIEEEKKHTPKSEDGKQYLWSDEIKEVLERKNKTLKESQNPDLRSVYTHFRKDFYVNFENSTEHPNNLSGEKLYEYTKKIVQQKRYRVNEEASTYLAVFAELILVHFIEHTKQLIKSFDKKSLNISVVNYVLSSQKYYLSDVGNNYDCFNQARTYLFEANVNQQKGSKFDLSLQTLNRAKFNGIVERVCKLYSFDQEQNLTIAGDFKVLCHGFLIELLRNFGNNIINMMEHKKERTINLNVVLSLISIYHTTLNKQPFHLKNTLSVIEKTIEEYKVYCSVQKQKKLEEKQNKEKEQSELEKNRECSVDDRDVVVNVNQSPIVVNVVVNQDEELNEQSKQSKTQKKKKLQDKVRPPKFDGKTVVVADG